ncbi:hypothetical protein QBK99_00695 [Corticibacterium sp. UT-5YL-CI-8]|nr:hypothetical protein [Tianweitania sp. UT-5YL-CI-8]
MFGPSVTNLVIVLAITRMPSYIRVVRAETLECRERLFVDASRVFGADRSGSFATISCQLSRRPLTLAWLMWPWSCCSSPA